VTRFRWHRSWTQSIGRLDHNACRPLIDGSSEAALRVALLLTPGSHTQSDWKVEFDEKISPPECGRTSRRAVRAAGGLSIRRDAARSRYIFRVLALIQPRRLFGIFQPLIRESVAQSVARGTVGRRMTVLAARLRPGGI